jgi:hypothetical protein
MPPNITAMLVMDGERRAPLLGVLESCGVEVLAVCDCSEARRLLETRPPVRVVVTDTSLPDGDWRRVLEIVEQELSPKIEVVVVCSCLGIPDYGSMCSTRAAMMCWSSLTNARRYGGLSKLPQPKAFMLTLNQKATNVRLHGAGQRSWRHQPDRKPITCR